MTAALELLQDSALLETLDPRHLEHLAAHSSIEAIPEGRTIFEQDDPVRACYMLVAGRVRLSFDPAPADSASRGMVKCREITLREIDRPGHLLGWSGMVSPFRYRTTATALTDCQLVMFERPMLEAYLESRPDFAVAFFDRLIWILGNRLRETRIRLVSQRYKTEVTAIRALLEQSVEVLPVDSPLYKIPYYLEHRMTLADAFQCLELVRHHGSEVEQDLAAMALEILNQVSRQLTLYQDLQRVYEAVARAPETLSAESVRDLCCRQFQAVYERLEYVITGEEKLPEQPGQIFIMNHLFNHPANTLPNRFQLTLDTHFVSSMILMRKYGHAPIRVIRKSRRDEFGHQRYYDRLGYIYVYSGHVDESSEDPHMSRDERRRYFFDHALRCLTAGENLVICPEGTSVATEDSPVAFKAGAFRLASYVDPEPLIVPVAVANFDKDITRATLVAAIQEPFRLSEHLAFPLQDEALYAFLERYRLAFASYVREAIAVAKPAPDR